MNIEIWSIGKENESFINEGIEYFFNKTKPYNPVELFGTGDIGCGSLLG